MNRYYLTFGNGSANANRYQVVHAPDSTEARMRVFEEYGPRWAFLYDEDQKLAAIDAYDLTPLPTELTTLKYVEAPVVVVPVDGGIEGHPAS